MIKEQATYSTNREITNQVPLDKVNRRQPPNFELGQFCYKVLFGNTNLL